MADNNSERYREIFDRNAVQFNDGSNTYSVSRRCKKAAEICQDRSLILDVGGALGGLCKYIPSTIFQISTDISFEMCRRSRSKTTVCCDALRLPFKANGFDAVVCLEAIYYFDSVKSFFRESRRVLKSNGILVISTFNPRFAWVLRIRKLLRGIGFSGMFFDDGLDSFVDVRSIRSCAESEGFVLESSQSFILIPFQRFGFLNELIEKLFLNNVGLFICMKFKVNSGS